MKSHNSNSTDSLMVLTPLAIWKWLAVLVLLLGFPFFILIDQMISSFKSTREQKISEFELEVEKIVGRAAVEQLPEIQLKEILDEYGDKLVEPAFDLQVLRMNPLPVSPLPFISARHFNKILRYPLLLKLHWYQKRLRRNIPGIKLLKWNDKFKITPDSDRILPKFVYHKLVEAITLRVRQRRNEGNDRRYADAIVLVKKYFNDDPNLVEFVKYGKLKAFHATTGEVFFLHWTDLDMNLNDTQEVSAYGHLAVIEEAALPSTFGLTRFYARKSHEWKGKGYALGWVDSRNSANNHLPFPFSATDRDFWARWFDEQPNGVYEKNGLLIALRRLDSRMVIVAARSLREVDLQLERRIFLTYLVFFLFLTAAVATVLTCRRNAGMALSIRWQLLGLFILSLALSSAAVVHFGLELLNGRRQFYENEAFKKLERIRKDIEENKEYVYSHLKRVGDSFTRSMLEFYRPGQKVPFSGTGIDQTIASYFDQAGVEHLYLFDAAGREVLKGKFSSNERRGLLPLVTSLAKLKLRLTGNLIEEGYSGAVSLMDLMLEETGGAKLADIQAILKHRESTAFELKFTDRKTHFFVGQFSPPGESNKVFVMVFIIKDRNFDQLYLDLMVDKLQKEKKIGRTIQLYYGKSRFSHGRYFEKTVLKDPFFHYDYANPDSSGIGKLTEPTRFAGVSIKDSYQFSNGRRFLFYSFKLANLDAFTPVLLFNYEGISEELRVLRVLLVVIFLVTLLVLWILGRMAVRSILQPIQMLRNAVEMVEAGDYSCRLSLPGEDELVDLSRAFNSMSKGLDEREKMTRYLSKSAVAAVQSDEGAALGGRKVPATILFCDIRNFTTISESHPAETVVSLLNSYFARMNLVIEKHGGDIDKFIGDAIMAQFIVSEKDGCSAAEMALNAVKCALAMMQELEAYNRERIKANDFPIMIGVGINSGEVIAGNIGSPGRMDHTVIGDTVNVASRLEGMSKLGKHTHVIISRSTLDLVEDCIEYEQLQETAVKGKTTAVEMFEVIGCRSGVGC